MATRNENELDSELEALWSEGLGAESLQTLKESISELKNRPVHDGLKQALKNIDSSGLESGFEGYLGYAALPLALTILVLIVLPQYSAKPVSAPLAYQIQATLAPATLSLEFNSSDIYLSDDFELLDEELQLMEEVL